MLRLVVVWTALVALALAAFAAPASAETSPPTCTKQVVAGPPTQVQFHIQDTGSGLQSIVVTRSDNADTPVPPFTVGTTDQVTVTSTKIDQSAPMHVTMTIKDVDGNTTICDYNESVTAARGLGVRDDSRRRGLRSPPRRTAAESGAGGFGRRGAHRGRLVLVRRPDLGRPRRTLPGRRRHTRRGSLGRRLSGRSLDPPEL